jgi:Zn-dependent protease with chaperone function
VIAGAVLGWLRGLLAVALLAGFYVLVFVLVAVDAVFVGLVIWATFAAPTTASNWTIVVATSIPAVFALLYGIVTVSRVEEPPPGAVVLPRRVAPELWRFVEELAAELGTRPPTRIFLTPEANAAVSEEARMLGFAVGRRTMYLGVPLLALPRAELRAVLCHEYAHYAGRHTRFGAVSYRGAAALQAALFRLRMTARSAQGISGLARFFHAVLNAYAKLYLWLSLAVRRRQELEADARAAAVAGPTVTAAALRSVHAIGHAWAEFLALFIRPVQRLGYVPEDLFGAFDLMLDDPLVQEWLAELRDRPVETNRSRLDSHPPLARRLARIEALPASEPETVGDGPLLTDRQPLLRVQRRLLGQARSRAALPWDRWADVAAEALAVELAAPLLDAAGAVGVTARPTLDSVLDLLERGRQAELGRRLTDAPDPVPQLAEALYALVGQALAAVGKARWVFCWTKGYLLVPAEETGRELEELAAAAARDGSAVSELRGDLARRGLDVEAAVPLVRRSEPAPAGGPARVEIDGQVPGFVAEELARQRTVRNFTLGVLAVLGLAWGVALLQPDEPQRYPSVASVNVLGTRPFPNYPGLLPTTSADPLSPLVRPSLLLPSLLLPTLSLPVTPIVVERGDTLSEIACRYRTSVRELQELNDMGSSTRIRAGQTLWVPTGPGLGLVRTDCG